MFNFTPPHDQVITVNPYQQYLTTYPAKDEIVINNSYFKIDRIRKHLHITNVDAINQTLLITKVYDQTGQLIATGSEINQAIATILQNGNIGYTRLNGMLSEDVIIKPTQQYIALFNMDVDAPLKDKLGGADIQVPTGTAITTTGKFGYGLRSSSDSMVATIAAHRTVSIQSYGAAAWIYFDGGSFDFQALSGYMLANENTSGPSTAYDLEFYDANDNLATVAYVGQGWHHIAFSAKIGQQFKIWFDGVQLPHSGTAIPFTTTITTVSAIFNTTKAIIDDIVMVRREFTNDEIAYIWNSGIGNELKYEV